MIGNLNISPNAIVNINKLKIICQCDIKHITTLHIKTIMSVLKSRHTLYIHYIIHTLYIHYIIHTLYIHYTYIIHTLYITLSLILKKKICSQIHCTNLYWKIYVCGINENKINICTNCTSFVGIKLKYQSWQSPYQLCKQNKRNCTFISYVLITMPVFQ